MKIVRPITINDSVLLSSSVAETDYAAWSSGTTYAVGNRVIYVASNVHKVYESVQNSNTNHNPTLDTTGTWWTDLGSTNRWKMFDTAVTSQTTKADSIAISLQAPTGQRVDSISVLNIDAASVHIVVTDAVDGVIYDQTFSLVADSGVTDWYSYLFEPVARLKDFTVTDLPPYAAPKVDITLTATGETVACGAVVFGLQVNLGATQYGTKVGITDYSTKSTDIYGNFTIVERAYSKIASFDVIIDSGKVDWVASLLAGYRATPIVYVGSDDYNSTVVYGFFKDFSVNITSFYKSYCSIEIEGLT
jgi:hypothetical protein